jgi:esterase/lipase
MALLLPGTQSNSIALSMHNAFNVPVLYSGIGVAILLGLIIFGGVKRIGKVAEIVVPFMAGAYILMAVVIMALNITEIPAVLSLIIKSAFHLEPAFAGVFGMAIAWGVKRGIYSNEAGQGTAPHAAAAAEVTHPVKQGLVQAFSVYIDTLFVCTATALMILFTGQYNVVNPEGGYLVENLPGAVKPFKDIALGLAAKGIASIRYVKRTLVYPQEYSGAFTVKEETINDALTAVNLSKTIPQLNKKQIYVFGLSLGGMLAPRIATLSPDIKGIIMAAAPARKFTDLIIDQNHYMYGLSKDTTAATKEMFNKNLQLIETSRLTKLGTMKPDSLILQLPASYWIDLNNYDQVATAKKLSQRIMVIQGGMDFQVSDADYKLWTAALGKKSNASLKFYPELNHPLTVQTAKGTAEQYRTPANVSEVVINDLATWIKASK